MAEKYISKITLPDGETYTLRASGGGGGSSVDYTATVTEGTELGKITIDGSDKTIYAPEAGDKVAFTQSRTSGTLVGTININGTDTKLYAPSVTDTNVTQTLKTDSVERPLLTTSIARTATATSTAAFSTNITANASTGTLTATKFKGDGSELTGIVTLDDDGLIPTSLLPSYVDDVLEYSAKSSFPTEGESGKIYVDKATNLTYRWSGSAYVEISPSLALGETSSTAYAGNKGKALADKVAALPTSYAPTDAEKNVQSDWNVTDTNSDAYIKNKPTIPDISTKQDKLTTQTAYTSKGSATKVPQITTNSLGQVTGITEVDITSSGGDENVIETVKVGGNALTVTDKAVNITNQSLGQYFATCSTAAATKQKEITITNFKPVIGGIIVVKFSNATGASPTLRINSDSTTVHNICFRGNNAVSDGVILANDTVTLMNCGTYYQIISIDHLKSNKPEFGGATTAAAGNRGLVPSPAAGDNAKYLKGDGTWSAPTASDVGLGNVGNFKAVSTAASQGLTATEQSNARANIGAGTSSFSGSYNDLTDKPTIPTVNNATLTIQKNGTNVKTFTANASSNVTANITVPTKVSELTNDSGFTSNTGTVTSVKVGNTSYSPSSGVVSLPAYPTSVASATKATKDGDGNVITDTYLPLKGGTLTGGLTGTNITTSGAIIQKVNSENTGTGYAVAHYAVRTPTGTSNEVSLYLRKDTTNNISAYRMNLYKPSDASSQVHFECLNTAGVASMRIQDKTVVTNYTGTTPTTISSGTSSTATGANGTIYFQYS